MPAPPNIKVSGDLETTKKDTENGFYAQALAKYSMADSFVKEASAFGTRLSKCEDIEEALSDSEMFIDVATASGLSNKAMGHLSTNEIKSLSEKILQSEDKALWREQLVSRFLLTRGDSLGGSMRNYVGQAAGKKFVECVCSSLNDSNVPFESTTNGAGKIQMLEWEKRILVLDKNLAPIKKNIDIILMDSSTKGFSVKERLNERSADDVLACGELKGGIDPAGADEHWKTASAALNRIREWSKSMGSTVSLFFVGAAIVPGMAREIFEQLQSDSLNHAANLHHEEQMECLATWLIQV